MKKLNKILAAISTAALTFCVWGTQTQAKVETNEKDIPTHINAETKEEFFGDLQKVLDDIESRLVVAREETAKIYKSFLNTSGLTDDTLITTKTYSEWAQLEYDYALRNAHITNVIAIGYLYNLLLNSNIRNQQLNNVHRLIIKNILIQQQDIIFQLPNDNIVYYTPCLSWFMWPDWMRTTGLKPTPMTVSDHFSNSPLFEDPDDRIILLVTNPTCTINKPVTTLHYQQTELINHAITIIPKLISIAGKRIEDKTPMAAFRDHGNHTTDYDEFVIEYNKKQK